jgi:hypothetical protein
MSLPENWDSFNAMEVSPWFVTRQMAAETLRKAMTRRATKQALVQKIGLHEYRISSMNTVLLKTAGV